MDFVYGVMHFKLILIVFFIELLNIFGYLQKNTLLSETLILFCFRLVYLKTDTVTAWHSYRLPQKQHHISKSAVLHAIFQIDPYLKQKDP